MTKTLVTGATGGIGSALCHELALERHSLVLTARDPDRLQALSATLRGRYDVPVSWHSLDFGDLASIRNALAAIGASHPTLDSLVLMPPQVHPAVSPDEDLWLSIFRETFVGPLTLLEGLAPRMATAESRAKIAIVSGITSVQALSSYATSGVIRAAWLAEAKALADRLAADRIHVNTLSLGGVLTDRYRTRLEDKARASGRSFDEQMQVETSNVPLGKYGEPREIGRAICTLLGEFTDHITGQNIVCDGGFIRSY